MEIWPPLLFLDSIFLPPVLPHVASYATSEEHHPPLSSHQVDARAELDAGSPVLEAAYGYPALTEHGHCALGCATGMQRQHLWKEKRTKMVRVTICEVQTMSSRLHDSTMLNCDHCFMYFISIFELANQHGFKPYAQGRSKK